MNLLFLAISSALVSNVVLSRFLGICSFIFPEPLQLGQTFTDCIIPNVVLCCITIWPLPPHFGQVIGLVPALAPVPWHEWHSPLYLIEIFLVIPFIASSKVIVTFVLREEPCHGPLLLEEPPPNPLKNELSPNPPKPPLNK